MPETPAATEPLSAVGGRRDSVAVDGADIAFTRHPHPAPVGPGILLVHGGSANSSWWAPLVTDLSVQHTVATMDLSGHGRSGWRDAYSFGTWAAEIDAVAREAFSDGLVLVGHSLGGALACRVVAAGLPVHGLVLLDAVGTRPDLDERVPPATVRPPRLYETRAEAEAAVIARKASWPIPLQRHVAAHSVMPAGGGWRLHRDPRGQTVAVEETALADLAPTPVHVLLGGRSPFRAQFTAAVEAGVEAAALPHVRLTVVDGAGHDVMMDQPSAVARIVRAAAEG